jgi:hypothetical protein
MAGQSRPPGFSPRLPIKRALCPKRWRPSCRVSVAKRPPSDKRLLLSHSREAISEFRPA